MLQKPAEVSGGCGIPYVGLVGSPDFSGITFIRADVNQPVAGAASILFMSPDVAERSTLGSNRTAARRRRTTLPISKSSKRM
jgi:hypothetical protein